jgi:hypothetical protein
VSTVPSSTNAGSLAVTRGHPIRTCCAGCGKMQRMTQSSKRDRTTRFRRRLLLGASCALVASQLLACVSPTVPLPPPDLPEVVFLSDATLVRLVSLRGAQPNALIVVINRNEKLSREARVSGTLADGEGTWAVTLRADAGDILDITQELASGENSSPRSLVVPGRR